MIKKLSKYKITSRDGPFINVECNTKIINTLVRKINELVDVVNNQQIQLNNHECRLLDLQNRITALDDPTYHEAEPKPAENVQDKFAEQRKWIGCVCRFWNDESLEDSMYGELVSIFDAPHEDYPFQCGCGEWYAYCEPVKPTDSIIYKGGDNG